MPNPRSPAEEILQLRQEVAELRHRLSESRQPTDWDINPPAEVPDSNECGESKTSIEQLRQLASEQRTILNTVTAGIAFQKSGVIQWVNPAFTVIFGCTPEEIQGRDTSMFFTSPEDIARIRREAFEQITSKNSYTTEVRLRRKSGELFWCNMAGRAIDPQQPNEGSIWVLQDITERRQAEETLRLANERLDTAQAQARIGSWEIGTNHTPAYWSPQMFRFFNLEPASIGPPLPVFMELVHPDDREKLLNAHQHVVETGETCHIKYRRNPTLGPFTIFETTIQVQRDCEGNLLRMIGTLQDITEHHQTEESLRQSQARLEAAQAQAHIGSWEYDPNSKEGFWSKEMIRLLGLDPQSDPQNPVYSLEGLVHPEDRHRILEVIQHATETGEPGICEYRSDPVHGPERFFIVTCEVSRDAFGQPNQISGTLQEITERKRAEKESARLQDQLQQAMKMEAVGRLAGGVAHDFNNLLTVILGNTELAKMDLDPADPLAQHLAEVTKAASSASDLTHQLLAFSRRQIIEPRVLNLNEMIANLHKMLERLIGEDITLDTALAKELGSVKVDPGQFDQVLVNLAVNARDAMPDGGRLMLETANVEIDEVWCELHPGLQPGDFVMLAMTDTGQGMNEEVRRRIFEPFFTTKPQGLGTGLGLATIFGVVKQAGGTIEVYSELGHGTTFKIYLPRIEEPAEKLARTASLPDLPRGHETVLIVEDEASVRDLSAAFLKRQGYKVLTAANGGEAILCSEKRTAPIDLLLTDVVLPGLNGRELAERIQKVHPESAVLFTSGYTEDTIIRHGVMSEKFHFIGKPYSFQAITRKVRKVLDEHKASRENE